MDRRIAWAIAGLAGVFVLASYTKRQAAKEITESILVQLGPNPDPSLVAAAQDAGNAFARRATVTALIKYKVSTL